MPDIIHAMIYSYKNKNLPNIIESLINNTTNKDRLRVTVYEQHPIDHREKIESIGNVGYEHIFWDHQYGPTSYKQDSINLRGETYQLLMSDDIILESGWDEKCIALVDETENLVISGKGIPKISKHDKYFLRNDSLYSPSFQRSNYIDRNFIFSTREVFRSVQYPDNVKYFGEEELYSISLFCSGVDVWSSPSSMYIDLKSRTLENLYVPFSLEHNYNDFVAIFNGEKDVPYSSRTLDDFKSFHGLGDTKLSPLFYPNNDVLYDPNELVFQDIGGQRFIDNVKAIY